MLKSPEHNRSGSRKQKTAAQRCGPRNENLPVFSFISHKTLKSAGFILWQFSACFLKRGHDNRFPHQRSNTQNTHASVGMHVLLHERQQQFSKFNAHGGDKGGAVYIQSSVFVVR